MQLQTFKAPTMAAAIAQVKAAMGHDAVIMHTRSYKVRGWLPLTAKDVVEVTAAKTPVGGVRRRVPVQPPPGTASPGDSLAGVLAAAVVGAKSSSAGGSVAGLKLYGVDRPKAIVTPPPPALTVKAEPEHRGKSLLALPETLAPMVIGVSQDLIALKREVGRLVEQNRHPCGRDVPEVLFDHYHHLVQNCVAEEIAAGIVRAIHGELRADQLCQPDRVRERLAAHIERLVPTCGPIARKPPAADGSTTPHVLALIGQTGVGKTTTLAKLAANLKLTEGYRVGLITLDTYRIAAVEQLRRYAEIIGSPLRTVDSPDELRAAVAGLSHMDFVLIDTAGRSPRDAAKLDELRHLLAAAAPDDVHLVLSSTTDQRSVEMAYERFSAVRVDKMIFTKLDEASSVGVVLNVCHKVNKALSYVTTGQDVPNDIEVGRGAVLARMLLDGCGGAVPALSGSALAAS